LSTAKTSTCLPSCGRTSVANFPLRESGSRIFIRGSPASRLLPAVAQVLSLACGGLFGFKKLSFRRKTHSADSKRCLFRSKTHSADSKSCLYRRKAFCADSKRRLYRRKAYSADSKSCLHQRTAYSADSNRCSFRRKAQFAESKSTIFRRRTYSGDPKECSLPRSLSLGYSQDFSIPRRARSFNSKTRRQLRNHRKKCRGRILWRRRPPVAERRTDPQSPPRRVTQGEQEKREQKHYNNRLPVGRARSIIEREYRG
jgi:hypothetical protein